MVTVPPWPVSTDFGTCSYQFIIIITDPKNTRMNQTEWGQRRTEAPVGGGQGSKGVVVPYKEKRTVVASVLRITVITV
jgi:hypothetical protein